MKRPPARRCSVRNFLFAAVLEKGRPKGPFMASDFAVGFDFDHTLGIDNKLERTVALDMLASLAAQHGITYDGVAADEAIEATMRSYRSGTTSIEGAIAGFFEQFAPVGGPVLDVATNFRDEVVARAPAFIEARPEAEAVLARLDEMGVPYAILTNGWSPLQEEKARLLHFRGSVFVSERIGALKPARAAFDVLAKHFELPFERIWYVGDDPVADCAGAAALGMQSVWYDWEERAYPPDLAKPTATIHTLDELIALLQGQTTRAANERA
jgi:HAD superfamily hydrolase (TIGR01549 family)